MTFGHVVLARDQDALDSTRVHERVHVRPVPSAGDPRSSPRVPRGFRLGAAARPPSVLRQPLRARSVRCRVATPHRAGRTRTGSSNFSLRIRPAVAPQCPPEVLRLEMRVQPARVRQDPEDRSGDCLRLPSRLRARPVGMRFDMPRRRRWPRRADGIDAPLPRAGAGPRVVPASSDSAAVAVPRATRLVMPTPPVSSSSRWLGCSTVRLLTRPTPAPARSDCPAARSATL